MSNPSFLRHTGNGRIFPWNPAFDKRKDMEPYFPDEAPEPVQVAPEPEPVAEPVQDEGPEDLATMHHMKLKKLVADHGGTYVSRADAIAFLNSKGIG